MQTRRASVIQAAQMSWDEWQWALTHEPLLPRAYYNERQLETYQSRALLFPVHGQRRSQPFHRCEFQAWCVCGRVAYVEMDLPIYLSICIWTYVFTLIRTCINIVFICWTVLLCSKAFAAPPHPECTGQVFLEPLSIVYTTLVLPHAQYSFWWLSWLKQTAKVSP